MKMPGIKLRWMTWRAMSGSPVPLPRPGTGSGSPLAVYKLSLSGGLDPEPTPAPTPEPTPDPAPESHATTEVPTNRGLHSSTFQLNASTFYGILCPL